MAGERRLFSITVTKDKSASDTAQVPAEGASVQLYFEGATSAESKALTVSVGATLAVHDTGSVKATDLMQVGTTSDTVSVTSVDSQTQLTVVALTGSFTVPDDTRLRIISRTPTLFDNDRSDNTDTRANPLTTDAQGYAEAYVEDRDVDVLISGTGLTTTLKKDRGAPQSESLLVTEYGMKGDGSTNDQPKLVEILTLAARSASPLTEIVFPPGTYLFSTSTAVPLSAGALKLRGMPGAIIRPTTGQSPNAFLTASTTDVNDIEITGLQFDNPSNTADYTALSFAGTTASDRVRIHRNVFRDLTPSTAEAASAIKVGNDADAAGVATNVNIYNNDFISIAGPAIVVDNAESVVVRDNYFSGTRRAVEAIPTTTSYTLSNLRILDNHMVDQVRDAVFVNSPETTGSAHFTVAVTGNYITFSGAVAGSEGISINAIADVNVTGNTIINPPDIGISVTNCIGPRVFNNYISAANQGIVAKRTNVTYWGENAVIHGNVIKSSTLEAIVLDAVSKSVVSNNAIDVWGTTAEAGIQLLDTVGGAEENLVSANWVSNGTGSGAALDIGAGVVDTTAINNALIETTAVSDSGTTSKIWGNVPATGDITSNVSFAMSSTTMRFAQGTVTEDAGTNTLTLTDDGNYSVIDVSGTYDTITPIPQAGTVVIFRVNLAAGSCIFTEGGNIELGTLGADTLELFDEDGITFVSSGDRWIVVGTRSLWNWASSGYVYTDQQLQVQRVDQGTGVKVHSGVGADVTGTVANANAAAVQLSPAYTSETAGTVTKHNYFLIDNPALNGGSAPTITNSVLFDFSTGVGNPSPVLSGTTKTSPGTVDAWITVDVNGTLHYIPCYTSQTT